MGYTVHPVSSKMYRDLRSIFWWNNMKREIAQFIAQYLTCQQVKGERKKLVQARCGSEYSVVIIYIYIYIYI